MTDNVEPSRRSQIMQSIKSTNTSPELLIRSIVHRMGYRYRLHVRKLPGTPDIVLPRLKKVIQVNGCFWHMHRNCKKAKIPKSNADFWRAKLLRNRERDRYNRRALTKMGWKVLEIWQCTLKRPERLISRLKTFLEDKT